MQEYNKKYNLTSITGEREITYKHFFDSLAGVACFEENATVLEVGSGGGFPSIPLKIARGDLQFSLLESTGKKCEFLRVAVEALGLNGVQVLNRRAEEAAQEGTYRERYDVCCARAVARLNTLAEYCMPFVKKAAGFLLIRALPPKRWKRERMLFRFWAESKRSASPILFPSIWGRERSYGCKKSVTRRRSIRADTAKNAANRYELKKRTGMPAFRA